MVTILSNLMAQRIFCQGSRSMKLHYGPGLSHKDFLHGAENILRRLQTDDNNGPKPASFNGLNSLG